MNVVRRFESLVRREPMLVIGSFLNLAVVMIGAFGPGLHLTSIQMAALGTISTAVTSAAAAFLTTPVNLGVINAAVSTVLVAGAAFGLHLTPAATATVVAAVSTILSHLMWSKVSPVSG